jgi:cytochrome d ubiquinol oxidase subunit II
MTLQIFWFCLIAVLWGGYFVLEGFDFGVGMLQTVVPRNERERGMLFETIGPHWDGNETWLVVAGGATFAAFPAWYATMFSGYYIALLLVLVLLIVRVLSFEWRERSESPRWKNVWLGANVVGSFGAPLVWGVGLAALLYGTPIDSDGHYTGNVLDLFNAYTVVAGVAVVLIFAFHGAVFLTLRTVGEVSERARHAARQLAIPAVLVGAIFLLWTVKVAIDRNDKDLFPPALPAAIALVLLALAALLAYGRRTALTFALTAGGILAAVATLFTSLYPRVMVSSTDFANSLTVEGASSSHYALTVMTVVALIVTPLVLLYQGWTYYVFRHRIGDEPVGGATPAGGST